MALCTLENVRTYLDIPVDKKDPEKDALYQSYIDRISVRMNNYCDRIFESTTYTEYYDGGGMSYLYTNQYPIISVTSINDDSGWSWTSSTVISGVNYRVANNSRSILLKNMRFGNYTENVKIVYIAGYATIPGDLIDACATEVVAAFKKRKDPHITAKTADDGSGTRYQTNFLPSTKGVLDKYKNKAIV